MCLVVLEHYTSTCKILIRKPLTCEREVMQVNGFFINFKQVCVNFLRREMQTLRKESKSKMCGDISKDIARQQQLLIAVMKSVYS